MYPQRSCSTGSRTQRILRAPGAASCLDDDDVAAFLHGHLSPARIRMLDQHVVGCPACRELLSALATGTTSVTPAPPGAGDAPSHLIDALAGDAARWLSGGRTLGAYRLLGLLGAGGMGTVYLAEHTLLGRRPRRGPRGASSRSA